MSSKAYPAAWADDEATRAAADRWQRRGLLTPAQQAAIDAVHPIRYYRPHHWIRLLLLIATLFGAASGLGFLLLATESKLSPGVYATLVVLAAIALLEVIVRRSQHYRSGVDNALLYIAVVAWGCLAYELTNNALSLSFFSINWLLLMLAVLLAAMVRYADPVVAAACFIAALWLAALILMHSKLGRLLLPFGFMAIVGALLLALRQLPTRTDYYYYRSAGLVLRALSLAVLYLAGNYLVVREGNAELLGGGGPSGQVALAPLFYLLTAVVPLVYIGLSLRRHDRLLLTMGLLTLAFSLFTLRYYRSLLPPEIAATLGGLALLVGALAALRYLRTPRHGLTAEANKAIPPQFNLESLIIAETVHVPTAPVAGYEFGGGQSGGGGADGRF
jgi:hypothetical protein